jgi:hypothetical protein
MAVGKENVRNDVTAQKTDVLSHGLTRATYAAIAKMAKPLKRVIPLRMRGA